MVNYEFFIEAAMDGLLLNLDFEIKPRIMIFMIFLGLTTTLNHLRHRLSQASAQLPTQKRPPLRQAECFLRSFALCVLYAIRILDQFAENLWGKLQR